VLPRSKEKMLRIRGSMTDPIWIGAGALYVLSYGLSLVLPNAYFWDDWINYFNMSATDVRGSTGPFSGFSPLRLVLEGWMADHWISGFHILTFLLFPIAALALKGILRRLPFFSNHEKVAIVCLFLLLPVNSARSSMTIFMYSSCYASFFVGWWIYVRSNQFVLRLLSLVFFINSFDTASLLFFMAVPIVFSFLTNANLGLSKVRWVRQNLLFIIAPVAFWIIEPKVNPTLDAVRAEYYTPRASGILRGLLLLLILCGIGAFGIFVRRWRYETHRGQIQLMFGALVTWIGIFPYMTLGHFPNIESLMISFVPGQSDWDSRHQLLMPFGIAISIIGLLNLLGVPKLSRGIVPILLISSVLNLSFSQEYYLDSIKSAELLREFASNEEVGNLEKVLIDDQALRFNARGRRIRSYEWDMMLNASRDRREVSSEILRFVDCTNFAPEAIVTVTATNGKFKSLVTRRVGIKISVTELSLC
jgi:hypothetical protein